MRKTLAGTLALVALAACSRKAPSPDAGLGAGAASPSPDTALVRETPAAPVSTPAATPSPDTTRRRPVAQQPNGKRATDQTQSGVTDAKTGASTLGKAVTKPRADQEQAVTAKGDVLVAKWDSAAGGWTYHAVGDTAAVKSIAPGTTKGDTAFNRQNGDSMKPAGITGSDTSATTRAPGSQKGDSAFNRQVGDSLKPIAPPVTPPIKADTTLGPVKGDTALKRTSPDSTTKP